MRSAKKTRGREHWKWWKRPNEHKGADNQTGVGRLDDIDEEVGGSTKGTLGRSNGGPLSATTTISRDASKDPETGTN